MFIDAQTRTRIDNSCHLRDIQELAPGADAAVPAPGAGVATPESLLFEHATQASATIAAPTHLIQLADMIYLRLL